MIGKNIPRVDAYEKVTGKAVFTTDLQSRYPNTLHVAALRSPHAHANIVSLDCEKARALPGVAYVLTGKEPGVKWGMLPHTARPAKDRALWAGQAVAWVAAESPEIAREAVGLIDVEYEPLPHVLTWQESFGPDPVSVLEPEWKRTLPKGTEEFDLPNVSGAFYVNSGETDEALSEADVVLEETFWTGKKTVSQLEVAAALAYPTAEGGLELYSNGCGVHIAIRSLICRMFGLPASKVRATQPYMGGSFGNRNTPYMEGIAALLALKTKRPVYFELSREEMFFGAPSSWAVATRLRMGATKDGTLIGKDLHLIEEIGASVGGSLYNGRLSSSATGALYAIPNIRMRTCSLLTNTVPAGQYRGLGAPDTTFAQEGMIDRLAEKLGISPLEIRLRNILPNGGVDDYGQTTTSIGVADCLRTVAGEIDIDTPSVQDDPVWIKGKGIACAAKQGAHFGRGEAEVLYYQDGNIELRVSTDNHGMGSTTTLVQIACEELGVSHEKVRIVVSDTALTPYDCLSASSSSIYRTGNAVRLACLDALSQLKEAAARMVGVPIDFIRIEGDTVHITGSHVTTMPVSKLFADFVIFKQDVWGLQAGRPVRGVGVYNCAPMVPQDEQGRSPRMFNHFQYAATAVEIAVNRLTGQIRVLRAANAGDCGRPISPKLLEGQLEGALHMAIGFCLNEETLYDEQGRVINANLSDYRLPMILDMPRNEDVKCFNCPDPLPDGPYGAKGMSEASVSALGPAIAAALYQAVGVRMNDYPMTAEKVLAAIQARERSS